MSDRAGVVLLMLLSAASAISAIRFALMFPWQTTLAAAVLVAVLTLFAMPEKNLFAEKDNDDETSDR